MFQVIDTLNNILSSFSTKDEAISYCTENNLTDHNIINPDDLITSPAELWGAVNESNEWLCRYSFTITKQDPRFLIFTAIGEQEVTAFLQSFTGTTNENFAKQFTPKRIM